MADFLQAFGVPYLGGLFGFVIWFFKTYKDESDDRVTASWHQAQKHTRATLVSLLMYTATAFSYFAAGLLSTASRGAIPGWAVGCAFLIPIGYSAQSYFESRFGPPNEALPPPKPGE